MTPKLIWGLPIRLFHWSLVGFLSVSLYTGHFGEFDDIDTHMWAGYGLIALLLFRITFGFFAKGYARFTEFVKGPSSIRGYVNEPTQTVGHNPLGAVGIIAMLLAILVQVATGVFVSDEIFVEGPLYHLVSAETSRTLTVIHAVNHWLIIALVAMHLLAILAHEVKGHRLVKAMITGKKLVSEETKADNHQFWLACLCFGFGLGAVYVILYVL